MSLRKNKFNNIFLLASITALTTLPQSASAYDFVIGTPATPDMPYYNSAAAQGGTAATDPGQVTLTGPTTDLTYWVDYGDTVIDMEGGLLTVSGYKDTVEPNGTLIGNYGNVKLTSDNLTIGEGSSISNALFLETSAGTTLKITGGIVELNDNDTILGNIKLTDGNLQIDNVVKNTTSTYVQSGGNAVMLGNTALNNANDKVLEGNLSIGDGTSVGVLNVTNGTISQDAKVDITATGYMNIEGGNVTLDKGDTWRGTVTVSDDGSLSLVGMTKNQSGILKQDGGTINVTGVTNPFDLNNEFDQISSGNLNIGDGINETAMNVSAGAINEDTAINLTINSTLRVNGGEIALNNNDTLEGDIIMTSGTAMFNGVTKSSQSDYTQTGGESRFLGEGVDLNSAFDNISGGKVRIGQDDQAGKLTLSKGTLGAGVTTDIEVNGVLNVAGGTATLNTGDDWYGTVNVSDGTLNVSGITKGTATTSATPGVLTQTGGTVNISNTTFDLNNSDDKITGGKLNIGNSGAATINVSKGTIGTGSEVTLSQNSSINISDTGSVSLDNTDIWNGNINVRGGSLALVGITAKTGALTQIEGSTTVTGVGFDLNNSNDKISGGTFNVGDGNTETKMSVSQGSVTETATVNLTKNSELTINGGSVELGNKTTWNGDVNITSGSLSINDVVKSGASKFIQEGGTTTVSGTKFDLNNTNDAVYSGTFNVGDGVKYTEFSVSGGTISSDAVVNINNNAKMSVTGGNVSLDSADRYQGEVAITNGTLNLNKVTKTSDSRITQTGGTTTVIGDTFALNNKFDNISAGTFNIGNGTESASLDVANGNIKKDAKVNLYENSELNVIGGNVELNSTDDISGSINVSSGNLKLDNVEKNVTGVLTQTGGTTTITGNTSLNNEEDSIEGGKLIIGTKDAAGTLTAKKGIIENDATVTIAEKSTLNVDGAVVNIDDDDNWQGEVKVSDGTLTIKDSDVSTNSKQKFNQTGGTTNLKNTTLALKTEASKLSGGMVEIDGKSKLVIDNSAENSVGINTSEGTVVIKRANTLQTNDGVIDSEAKVVVESGALLEVTDKAKVSVDGINDDITGNIKVTDGTLYISDDLTKVTTANGKFIQTGGTVNVDSSSLTLADTSSKISGGSINLSNRSKLTVTNGGGAITGGNVIIDDTSVLNYLASKGLVRATGDNQINIDTSGLVNFINNAHTVNKINNLVVDNRNGDGVADFAIDIAARDKAHNNADRIAANSISSATGDESATINISDWNFVGGTAGNQVPLDKHIRLGRIFESDNIDENITFTATDKEILTPIGKYKLNASPENDGSYTLDLTKMNPLVYRGQIATASQYFNQLVVNDTLFNRAQVRRYGASFGDKFANKTAVLEMQTSYERTLRDGGIWTEVYGNFEKLKFNEGIGKVSNDAWGILVGGDFGAKELKNGWTYVPSVYLGYNGAHQRYKGMTIVENGAQLGHISSWIGKNATETALIYAGFYGTDMNLASVDVDEHPFNYFVGLASKTAYDIKMGKYFKVQPALTLAYNLYGKQDWKTDYGYMRMESGLLNGFNIAPNLNFVLEREDWKAYLSIAYAWNIFGGLDGRAGNIDLDSIKLSQGYLQYGFGFSRTFSDRFNMYAQATIRNIGRTGIVCQGGMNWRF